MPENNTPPPTQVQQQVQSQTNTPSIPDLARQGSRDYSDSHYKFLSTLIESESARSFYLQIAATDFSHQCVNAFHKVLTSGFDKNAILAANKDVKIRIVDFKIKLNLMVTECHESDIQNSAFLTFQENILDTFSDFVSRSQNSKERDQLLRSEYGMRTEETRSPVQPQQGSRFGRQQ